MTHGGDAAPKVAGTSTAGGTGLKPSPWRRERQQPRGFAPEPVGLWLQKAFGKCFEEQPSSSSPLPTHRQPVSSILPGGNSGQQMLKGQPAASIRGLICPLQKHHQCRAPHPTWDMLPAKAMPKRCSLEGLSPPTRSISQPSSP